MTFQYQCPFFFVLAPEWVVHSPPWRNWLARSAVNRKVAGSIPAGGAPFVLIENRHHPFVEFNHGMIE